MPPHASKPSTPQPHAESPEIRAWREAAFWSLLLAAAAALGVLTALDDSVLLHTLADLTTHGKTTRFPEPARIDLILEHVRWWILSLPIAALLLRRIPITPLPASAGRIPPFHALSIPPVAVGLLALQLCVGAGFLTGTWAYIQDRFWFPAPVRDSVIRDAFVPRGAIPISRRLNEILPPDAKVYLLTDEGEAPVFVNYYVYPRRIYSSETESGFVDEAQKPEFWQARRKEGYRWVYVYRPGADPVGGGHLIELGPSVPNALPIGSPEGETRGGTQPERAGTEGRSHIDSGTDSTLPPPRVPVLGVHPPNQSLQDGQNPGTVDRTVGSETTAPPERDDAP